MNIVSTTAFPKCRVMAILVLAASAALAAQSALAVTAFATINLVTDDQTANPAQISDPNLINAWGMSFPSSGPFWISDNGAGVSTLYSVNPTSNATSKLGLTVSIPGSGNVTGQVFNGNSAAFNGDNFIFVSEDGTISGWRNALGTSAETLVLGSSTDRYKGVAEASVSGNSYVYAANFATGRIDVVKGSSGAPDLAANFTDPNLPSGYAPFNIQTLDDKLYVSYALQDSNSLDEIAGAGLGFVSVFDVEGNFQERLASQGTLNAPWGLAIAPSSFGEFAGDVLVGNFGDGRISAFDPLTQSFAGQLAGGDGQPLVIDGLWALSVGNDGQAGSSQALYFTAGPGAETHGLFGAITVVPVPAAFWLFGSGLSGFGVFGRRHARRIGNRDSGQTGQIYLGNMEDGQTGQIYLGNMEETMDRSGFLRRLIREPQKG